MAVHIALLSFSVDWFLLKMLALIYAVHRHASHRVNRIHWIFVFCGRGTRRVDRKRKRDATTRTHNSRGVLQVFAGMSLQPRLFQMPHGITGP